MLLRILVIGAIVYFVYIIVRQMSGGGGGRAGFKCSTCRSCGKLFDDGVLCRFQGRETFKNKTHIANCIDYEKR